MRDVEDEVNEVLLRDLPVSAFVTTLDEARRLGAMALFGEKYGDAVRVVDVGEREPPTRGSSAAARTSPEAPSSAR